MSDYVLVFVPILLFHDPTTSFIPPPIHYFSNTTHVRRIRRIRDTVSEWPAQSWRISPAKKFYWLKKQCLRICFCLLGLLYVRTVLVLPNSSAWSDRIRWDLRLPKRRMICDERKEISALERPIRLMSLSTTARICVCNLFWISNRNRSWNILQRSIDGFEAWKRDGRSCLLWGSWTYRFSPSQKV